MEVLNRRMKKKGYETPIKIGVGMAYGRVLMVKAGYSGIGIADVDYMGDVVNRAAKLSAKGNSDIFSPAVMIDSVFADKLNEENRKKVSWSGIHRCHAANVVDSMMEKWFQQNCN